MKFGTTPGGGAWAGRPARPAEGSVPAFHVPRADIVEISIQREIKSGVQKGFNSTVRMGTNAKARETVSESIYAGWQLHEAAQTWKSRCGGFEVYSVVGFAVII